MSPSSRTRCPASTVLLRVAVLLAVVVPRVKAASLLPPASSHVVLTVSPDMRITGVRSAQPCLSLDAFTLVWTNAEHTTRVTGTSAEVKAFKNFHIPLPMTLNSLPPRVTVVQLEVHGPWGAMTLPYVTLEGLTQKGHITGPCVLVLPHIRVHIPSCQITWSSTAQVFSVRALPGTSMQAIYSYTSHKAGSTVAEKIHVHTPELICHLRQPRVKTGTGTAAALTLPLLGDVVRVDVLRPHVRVPQKNLTLTAEKISYYPERQIIEIQGHVRVVQKSQKATAELQAHTLSFDLKTKSLRADQAHISTNALVVTQDLTTVLQDMTQPQQSDAAGQRSQRTEGTGL